MKRRAMLQIVLLSECWGLAPSSVEVQAVQKSIQAMLFCDQEGLFLQNFRLSLLYLLLPLSCYLQFCTSVKLGMFRSKLNSGYNFVAQVDLYFLLSPSPDYSRIRARGPKKKMKINLQCMLKNLNLNVIFYFDL